MTHLAGRAGSVYIANKIIEDCEDAWVSGTNGVATREEDIVKVGDYSSKCVISSQANLNVVMYEPLAAGSTTYEGYTHVLCWAYCTVTTAADDFRLVIDSASGLPDGASETQMNFPALTSNTWKYCRLTNVSGKELADSTTALVVGLQIFQNHQSSTIYLDDIYAAKTVAGVKAWSLDYTTDMVDTTDFVDGLTTPHPRSFLPGLSNWSGSFEVVKDSAPLALFSQVGIELAEVGSITASATQMWRGNIVLTGIHPTVGSDGLVMYTYDFQGTGVLTVAAA